MRNIAESNMLLRAGVDLPAGLNLGIEEFCEGWRFLRTSNAKRLEKRIQAHGWNLIRIAGAVLRSGVGATAQQAIANALKLVLRPIDEHFNAAEVEHIELTQYPWFFLARIRVHPYLIHKGAVMPVYGDAELRTVISQQRHPPLDVPNLAFGGAMPQLKQMLILSQNSEMRA